MISQDLWRSLSNRQRQRIRPGVEPMVSATKLAIHKILELSTGHLAPHTHDWLELPSSSSSSSSIIVKHPYGWIVSVPSCRRSSAALVPQDLIDCCTFAAKHGCAYIMFDRDGALLSELPDYTEAHA